MMHHIKNAMTCVASPLKVEDYLCDELKKINIPKESNRLSELIDTANMTIKTFQTGKIQKQNKWWIEKTEYDQYPKTDNEWSMCKEIQLQKLRNDNRA